MSQSGAVEIQWMWYITFKGWTLEAPKQPRDSFDYYHALQTVSIIILILSHICAMFSVVSRRSALQ
jgi:hypothetical protein